MIVTTLALRWERRTRTPGVGREPGPRAIFSPTLGAILFVLCAVASAFASPNITGFDRLYGSATDSTYVHIYGTGFVPYNSASVTFGGVPATLAYPETSNGVQYVETQVPAGVATGPVAVVVTINGLQARSPWPFYVVGAGPYVHDFSPTSGKDAVWVTLNGEHFAPNGPGAVSAVTFNGLAAAGFHVYSDSTLWATTAVGVTTGPITVTTPGGSFITTTNYFVPPSVSGFSPFKGVAGTSVTIAGRNFLGVASVSFAGFPAASFTVVNNSTITAVVPAGVATGPISLTAPAAPFTTSSNFLVIPQITGFTPNAGPPGTAVTISGANFTDGGAIPQAFFNGLQGALQPGFSPYSLIALVPPGATTGPITVTSASGTGTSSSLFYLPPGISGLSANSGTPGASIGIYGTNFTGATAVTFNGQAVPGFSVSNDYTLSAIVPASVTTGPISVTGPGGTGSSGATLFYGPPSLFAASPAQGVAGTSVMLSGYNLSGATAVSFNGAPAASFTVSNNTTLSALVPAGASSGLIQVLTPGGSATTPSAFVVQTSDLSVSLVATPSPVTVGSNLTYVVSVTNAGPTAAPNARLGAYLPALSRLVSQSSTLGSFGTNPLTGVPTWTFGSLPSGGSAVVTLVYRTPATIGPISNLVSVAADDPDPAPLNNLATNLTWTQSVPLLSAALAPTNLIQLSWAADLTNYHLQYQGLPATNAPSWTNTTGPAVLSNLPGGLKLTFTETNAGSIRLYRLSH